MPSPLKEVRLAHYQQAYERELERRSEGLDRLASLIGIFTIIGGMLVYYFADFPEPKISALFLAFCVPLGLGVLFASIGFLAIAYMVEKGVNYTVLNTPEIFDSEILAAIKAGAITPENDPLYADEFTSILLEQYRDFGTVNQEANNVREKDYNRILRFATYSVVTLVLAAPVQFALKLQQEKTPIGVKIENPIHIMTSPNSSGGQSNGQPAQAPATPQATIKPQSQSQPASQPTNMVQPISLIRPAGVQINASRGDVSNIVRLERPAALIINEAAPKHPVIQTRAC